MKFARCFTQVFTPRTTQHRGGRHNAMQRAWSSFFFGHERATDASPRPRDRRFVLLGVGHAAKLL